MPPSDKTQISQLPTVLITGASSGIGLALAEVFAREGHHLILVARSEDKLRALQARLCQQHAIRVVVFSFDLTQTAAVPALFEGIQQQGLAVDVLVNNAGYGDYGEFASSDWAKLHGAISLNIVALTHLSRLFLPAMLERGSGKILNVASTAAFQPGPMMAVYFATKAYVLSFSEAIAAETEGTGVTVTALCPGPTQSNFAAVANMDEIAAIDQISSDRFPTAAAVAEYGYAALQKGQVVAVHNLVNKLLAFSVRLTPRRVLRRGVKQFMAPK